MPINGAPDNERIGIVDSYMMSNSAQIESVMEPTVKKLLQLIVGQLGEILGRGDDVAKILLVG